VIRHCATSCCIRRIADQLTASREGLAARVSELESALSAARQEASVRASEVEQLTSLSLRGDTTLREAMDNLRVRVYVYVYVCVVSGGGVRGCGASVCSFCAGTSPHIHSVDYQPAALAEYMLVLLNPRVPSQAFPSDPSCTHDTPAHHHPQYYHNTGSVRRP
jgi:hypothetical protein